jgi:hypothetical protein
VVNLGNSNVFLTITSGLEAWVIHLRVKQARYKNEADFELKKNPSISICVILPAYYGKQKNCWILPILSIFFFLRFRVVWRLKSVTNTFARTFARFARFARSLPTLSPPDSSKTLENWGTMEGGGTCHFAG